MVRPHNETYIERSPMAWTIHISHPSPAHAIEGVEAKAKDLIPSLSEAEAVQVAAAVTLVKANLSRVPESHYITGWLEGRIGPRYQTGDELQTTFGCHIATRERE